MSWTGRLTREDIGPGVWVLETDKGERMQLAGDIPEGLDGKRVQVEGRSESEAMGIGMIGGGIIEVQQIKRA